MWAFFKKITIITLVLVGCELIIANSASAMHLIHYLPSPNICNASLWNNYTMVIDIQKCVQTLCILLKGRFTWYDSCCIGQWLTTGPQHDLQSFSTSEHVLKRCDNRHVVGLS